MGHAVSHLAGILLLSAVFVASGALLEKLVPTPRTVLGSPALARFTFGVCLWIAVLFVLASIGMFRVAVVAPLAAVPLVAVCLWWMRSIAGGHRRMWRPDLAWPNVLDLLGLVAPALVIVALFFLSAGPAVDHDDGAYHLTVPKIYMENGGFVRLPFFVYSTWPLNIELLFGLAMILQDYILAKLVHLMFLVALMVAVYRLAARHSSTAAGCLALTLLLGNLVLLHEASVAYIDLGFAFFFFMAFSFALEYLQEGDKKYLMAAGICCGIVAGSKLTGALAAPCIALLVLVSKGGAGRQLVSLTSIRDVTVCLAVPAFLLALPWYVRSWVYTGNPVYPFLYDWFGGVEWNRDLGQALGNWFWSLGMGRTFTDYLLLPIRVILEGRPGYDHFDGRVNPLWLGIIPLSLVLCPTSPVIRRALGTSAVFFVTWALSSQQSRFLIPILPLLAVAGGVALAAIGARVLAGPMRGVVGPHAATALTVGLVGIGLVFLWPSRFTVRTGLSDGSAMLRHGIAVPGDAEAPLYRFVNAALPPSAKLLLLNTNHGFFLDRDYIADSFFGASQINAFILNQSTPSGVVTRLRELGVTHVIFATDDWGVPSPPILWAFLADPRYTQLIYTSPDQRFQVFAVTAL